MRLAVLTSLALLTFAAPALAQETSPFPKVEPGQTLITLTATEQTKLKQDTVTASLKYELDGPSANEIQDKINKAMTQAVQLAKGVDAVKVSTGSYYVYIVQDDGTIDPRTGRPFETKKTWRGMQSMTLESKDAGKLLDLVGKIQTLGLTMENLNYSLSPDVADSARDDLLNRALGKIQSRAALAAKTLGKGNYDIQEISVDGASQPYPQPRVYMMKAEAGMAAAADVAAPVAEAGEDDVSMTVTARVLLKP